MSLLLETIRVANRSFQNLLYHQQRLEKSMQQYFPKNPVIELANALTIPDALNDDIYKCRVLYDEKIRQIEFLPYKIQPVCSLSLVSIPSGMNYSCKWADRTWINQLRQSSAADDILMTRDNLLTDTSYANVALWDGYRWFTPRTPLLEGTRRAQLLSEGILTATDIFVSELGDFQQLKLLNAMMEFTDAPVISVEKINHLY